MINNLKPKNICLFLQMFAFLCDLNNWAIRREDGYYFTVNWFIVKILNIEIAIRAVLLFLNKNLHCRFQVQAWVQLCTMNMKMQAYVHVSYSVFRECCNAALQRNSFLWYGVEWRIMEFSLFGVKRYVMCETWRIYFVDCVSRHTQHEESAIL